MKRKKFVVAMSGGVDSSVAALLLNKKKYIVEGIFMKNWEEDDTETYCSALKDLKDAQEVCNLIGIPLHKVNFSEEYWNDVFRVFIILLKKGVTPNPDILCNKEIKFKALLKFVIEVLHADYLVTGHYVRKRRYNTNYYLLKGIDPTKDQSYFLYTLNQYQLSKVVFPIGFLKKKKVRAIAEKQIKYIAKKKDSTGICFIENKDFSKFLKKYIKPKVGVIVSKEGNEMGFHNGLHNYTIGQRKGLKIGGVFGRENKPWYVFNKNVAKNVLLVVQGKNSSVLMKKGIILKKMHWINKVLGKSRSSIKCAVKVRYRQKDVKSTLVVTSKLFIKVKFDAPISSVCEGQSAVFYIKDICIGGGIIYKAF